MYFEQSSSYFLLKKFHSHILVCFERILNRKLINSGQVETDLLSRPSCISMYIELTVLQLLEKRARIDIFYPLSTCFRDVRNARPSCFVLMDQIAFWLCGRITDNCEAVSIFKTVVKSCGESNISDRLSIDPACKLLVSEEIMIPEPPYQSIVVVCNASKVFSDVGGVRFCPAMLFPYLLEYVAMLRNEWIVTGIPIKSKSLSSNLAIVRSEIRP